MDRGLDQQEAFDYLSGQIRGLQASVAICIKNIVNDDLLEALRELLNNLAVDSYLIDAKGDLEGIPRGSRDAHYEGVRASLQSIVRYLEKKDLPSPTEESGPDSR